MTKRSGRKSQAANDFIEPLKPTITNAANVTNRPYNNGAVDISFVMSPASPIATSYLVKTVVPEGQTPITGTGSSSPVTITGLLSNTSYKFTITASNAIGNSPVSDESQSVLVTTVPQTPNAPTLSNNGAETNRVVWVAPANNGGSEITNYEKGLQKRMQKA